LLARPLVVVTGKGGVGKSTVAAALGLAAARRGLRTIVAEVAARDDVSRALAGSGTDPFVERAIGDGLHHISIDPESALEEYLVDQLPLKPLADALASSRTFGLLAAGTPGLRELLTVGKAWELAQPARRTPGGRAYDLVVLDAPATGHGVAILAAPQAFAGAARVGPVHRQATKIAAMLTDPARTAIVAVASPEEMAVNETLVLRDELAARLGQPIERAIVNGVLPGRFSAQEVGRLRAAPRSPAAHAGLALAARVREQHNQIARLRRGLRDVRTCTLPFVFAEELGAADLERLSRVLER
jgi:anion-transporting  ArsA/GET3 family ATPase